MRDRLKEMYGERRAERQRKLRRQPKMRRLNAGAGLQIPRLEIPRTARKRRRRNRSALRLPTAAIKHVLLSSRWVSLFLLVICVLALVLVGMDESFYLTMIPVEGAASIPPVEIVEASGLAGAHIFSANPGEAAEQIALIPGIISATVTLEWPNSAYIRITEDSPIAVWEQAGETYWVNRDGQLVPARVDIPGLLHIRADEPVPGSTERVEALETQDEAEEASDIDEVAEQVEQPMPFVPDEVLEGALQLRELRPNINVLNYDTSGGLSFQDGRGWRVYFGTGTNMAQKLAVYETLVEHLLAEQETPLYISVSNQEKPYYLASDS